MPDLGSVRIVALFLFLLRDHWPVCLALAGGGIRGGQAIGATDPHGKNPPVDPVNVGDLRATALTALGIDY